MPNRWLFVDENAAHMGAVPDTVYWWIKNNDMPTHKVGRLWKFMMWEVDHWVRDGKASDKKARK